MKMDNDLLERVEGKAPEEILSVILSAFSTDKIVLASSLGAEDQVLTHMVLSINPKARIFVLDTGRLHQETYDLMDKTRLHYGFSYEIGFPLSSSVEKLISKKGANSFYTSIENRKECCFIRKVEPLNRLLSTADAWITGLRREQAVTRNTLQEVEVDDAHDMIKINPLASWSNEDVWNYIKANNIPYNSLHDSGFPSIGCSPCTRAIKENEDIRAGRWWWETPDQKECGLHIVNGKLERKVGKEDGPFR
jgi:phosphoadenosine phosphosulfate reductase